MANYFASLIKIIQFNIFPQNSAVAVVLFIVCLAFATRSRREFLFLAFVLGTHALIFLVSKVTLTFISVGLLFPVILLVGLGFSKMPRVLAVTLLVLILGANLLADQSMTSIFKVQPGMNLKNERRVIERTYEIASGQPFSINTVTNPYLYPTLWAYLYQESGSKLPTYRGITTYAYAGQNVLPSSDESRPWQFLITEPEVNLPVKEITNNRRLLRTEKIGEFRLDVFVPSP